jgi:low temperature requirement protein LtrA
VTETTPVARSEQRVIWSELFIDLIWVFAIAELAGALAHGHGLGEVGLTLLLLAPLWWGWVGTTVYSNAAGARISIAGGRLVLFAVAACGLGTAMAIPEAYHDRGLLFGLSYAVLRLVLWLAMRPLRFYGTTRLDPFTIGLFVAAPLYVIGGALPGGWRVTVWVVAALVEILSPRLLGWQATAIRFETAHLPERFGLFIILALGETVIAMGGQTAALDRISTTTLLLAALSFVLICALWWTYFHFGADAMKHSLRTTLLQSRVVRDVFSYAHLAYIVGILCVAVGLKKLMAHPGHLPESVPDMLLAPGVAAFLAGFVYSRWRMFGAPTLFRTIAALLCVALAVVAGWVPIVATAVAATVTLLVLNGLEYYWVTAGRPLLLVGARPEK